MNMKPKLLSMAMALAGMLSLPNVSAQITNTVFSEDFSGSTLNTSKWSFQDRSLEGGKGNNNYTIHDGVVELTCEVTEQWWAGGVIKALPTFAANAETNVMVTVERVSETGNGTALRSCLWIMDPSHTFFVLFSDNYLETYWSYNRYIGQSGDNQTGGGTGLTGVFADEAHRDGGFHTMGAVANGKTIKLYLDGEYAAETAFPFSNVEFAIGTGARANGDISDTTFDNFKVQTIGAAAFSETAMTLVAGQTSSEVTVRIPTGMNASTPVTMRVVSSDPSVAIPVGGSGGTLSLTFAAGASNEKTITVKSVGPVGSAVISLENDLGLAAANSISVAVIESAGTRLTDDFAGSTIDSTKWTTSDTGFETGFGTFTAEQTGGQLVLSGVLDASSYWGGISLNTVKTFTATPELPLVFEMDRVSIDPMSADGSTASTAARTGVFLKTANRAQYLFFGQNAGETGWEYNLNATGSGTAIPAFAGITGNGSHHIKLVANGSTVKVYLDGIYGGEQAFAVNAGIQFEVGVYARDLNDAVKGVFDNVSVKNIYPEMAVAPNKVSTTLNISTNQVQVTVPKLLVAANAVKVTVTSQNPAVAIPEGAVNGVLTLNFAAGSANVQSFAVKPVGTGTTSFAITNDQSLGVDNAAVGITVLPAPVVTFTDAFAGSTLDTSNWTIDTTPLTETGTLETDSGVTIEDGALKIVAHCLDSDWPGIAVLSKAKYAPSELSPVDFEVDRTKMEYILSGGSGTFERTGIWIKDSTTNYVFFNFFDSHVASTVGGWQYNAVTGSTADNALPAVGTVMGPLTGTAFLDLGNHHMKVQVNGKVALLYVDGVFGASVPFPFTDGIVFGVGAYVNYANAIGSTVRGYFDNAKVTTYPPSAQLGSLSIAKQSNGDVVISWTGSGTLQSSSALPTWSDVSPAPTGTSYTVPAASLTGQKFFRLRQ